MFDDGYLFKTLDIDYELSESEKIELNKCFSEILKRARLETKTDKCFLCEKPITSFCNSHSVPRFTLKNIALNGIVNYSNKLVKLPLEKEEKGISEAGVFKLICRECDSKTFRDYEEECNYNERPNTKMLAEITIKNYLKSISKRMIEIGLYNQALTKAISPFDIYEIKEKLKVSEMDLNEYIEKYKKAKKVLNKNWCDEYFVLLYEKLDYVVPIAFQSNIALICDLEENIINDIYNKSKSYKLQDLQICVFPLKEKSIILVYIEKGNDRYRRFFKQLKKLQLEDKLSIINICLFRRHIFQQKNRK